MRERSSTPGRHWRPAVRIAVLAAAVALIAFAVAGTVVAKPTAPKVKSQPFMVQAIVSVETTAGTAFTASVIKGNHAMKALISKDVTFTVSASTVIVRINKEGATIIGPDDLAVGDRVLISGRIERTKSRPTGVQSPAHPRPRAGSHQDLRPARRGRMQLLPQRERSRPSGAGAGDALPRRSRVRRRHRSRSRARRVSVGTPAGVAYCFPRPVHEGSHDARSRRLLPYLQVVPVLDAAGAASARGGHAQSRRAVRAEPTTNS